MNLVRALPILLLLPLASAQARTVWRCLLDGSVSLSTAPEPGSQCTPKILDDNAANVPNLWGDMGVFHGTLYRREQDGKTVYGTRAMPGSTKLLQYSVATPAASPAHAGLGNLGKPRLDVYRAEFRNAAKRTGLDEGWLRAIAHAESAFANDALSAKGARGVMQLMPELLAGYGVKDPFSPAESISAGARQLKRLEDRYGGDRLLVAAAYNAGVAAVAQYGGVPPYAETQEYIAKVGVLYARYRKAMGLPPRTLGLQPAQ